MKTANFGYTPYWNLSVPELIDLARTKQDADKQLETELARRLAILVQDGHIPYETFVPD